MKRINILFFFISLLSVNTDAAQCESGWSAYKDEVCIKSFPDVLPYEEAKTFCSSQGSETAMSSLVMVKESEMQELLANYTQAMFDMFWLGSRYDAQAGEFRWEDGSPLTYTNWDEGYPRNNSDADSCVELRPVNAKQAEVKTDGKWADVNCQKRNGVMCQKISTWTIEDAVIEITKLRKKQEELETANQIISSRVVPVGSTYIEYYGQPSPENLWPELTWEDISGTYAGLFFRAAGGAAASWGTTQAECAPRITQMDDDTDCGTPYSRSTSLPASGWSAYQFSGIYPSSGSGCYEGLRFYTQGCETRPINQAVRIWKRIS